MAEPQHIILACDESYVMPMTVTIRSILESHRGDWPLTFHILSVNVSEQARARLHDSLPPGAALVHWVPVDMRSFFSFATQDHISNATYARLLIPKMLPNLTGRALYLDSDILVIDNLRQLWASTLTNGAVIGAVLDEGVLRIRNRRDPLFYKLPRVTRYFNAGVLLIDLERWRAERVAERALEYLIQNPQTPYSDQDALNVACDGKWEQLEPRWNFQVYEQVPRIADLPSEERPEVVHFVTREKPWRYEELNSNAHFYDSFRDRTAFARTLVERLQDASRTTGAIVRRINRVLRHVHSRPARHSPIQKLPLNQTATRHEE
jgi:lipopolysaccharide biosynthesis glycosyltransferase